jgi:intracellular multiplication protein IcmL
MAYDALEVVKHKQNFYRDSYRLTVMILLVAVIAIAILAAVLMYEVSHRPAPKYFATTNTGKLIPLIPLSEPNLSDSAILDWVSKAVTSVYTYDFVNYRKTFQGNSVFFTKDGWHEFLDKLSASRNLETVQAKKLAVSAVPAGAPIISNQSVVNGRYTWRVQIPIVVTYQSLSEQFNQQLLVNVMVVRLSTLSSKYGIGVEQFVVQQQ